MYEYNEINPLRVFESFSGYGSQSLALDRIKRHYPGFDYHIVGIAEIDRYAILAYNAVHRGGIRNYGDVTSINWEVIPDFDLLTWSSPCQDISTAGKGAGMSEGSETRSSLLWEVKKPIEIKKPRYILFENVKNFVGQKHRKDALKLFNMLEDLGYVVFQKVLNAKDFGVPQNRERIFVLAIRDENAKYHYPEPFQLNRRLRDILEENVSESYYLSDVAIKNLIKRSEMKQMEGCGFRLSFRTENEISTAVTTKNGYRETDTYIVEKLKADDSFNSGMHIIGNYKPSGHACGNVYEIGGVSPTVMQNHGSVIAIAEPICLNSKVNGKQPSVEHRIYSPEGIMTAITTGFMPNIVEPYEVSGHCFQSNHQRDIQMGMYSLKLKIPEATRKGFAEIVPGDIFDGSYPDSKTRGGRKKGDGKICQTITSCGELPLYYEGINSLGYRIRKLTPRECFRLMDLEDSDIDKIKMSGVSKTQQYKLAGNSIVIACLYHIFRKLFVDKEYEGTNPSLF